MDEAMYTGVEIHVSALSEYKKLRNGGGSVMLCAAISYNCRTNLELVKRNLTVQLYISDYFFQPHILNVIDRQKEIFQKDNAQPLTGLYTWLRPSPLWRRKRDPSLNLIRWHFLGQNWSNIRTS
jgi:hypothetical protein